MRTRDIVLQYVPSGTDDHRFVWCAWHDGDEEEHFGCGATGEEAIADLGRFDQERAEALEDAEHPEEDI